jgi:hypothetical protein
MSDQQYNVGLPDPKRSACSAPCCFRLAVKKGLCGSHYHKQRYYSNVEESRSYARDWSRKNAVRLAPQRRAARKTPRRRFTEMVAFNRSRGLEFKVPYEQWTELIKLPCHYCGGMLPAHGSGLDRKDNSIGYVPENVVPCCTRCNKVKNNCVSYESMLLIGQILRKQDGRAA